ncbi:MAG: hypothetical protein U0271_11780 [Polyangiaceae bacterium]
MMVAVGAAGCGSKDSTSSSSSSASKKGGKKKKKLPKKGAGKSAGKGKKGGDGSKTPKADDKKAPAATTGATDKKKVDPPAEGNPCESVPDGTASCDGNSVYFCAEKQLYQVDCDAHAKEAGFDSGTCFETDGVTDCLGCGQTEGGVVCCDASGTICCDEEGNCVAPEEKPADVEAEE